MMHYPKGREPGELSAAQREAMARATRRAHGVVMNGDVPVLKGASHIDKARTKALEKKKGSADYINAERKRQGHKPISARDKRIHEGMDKYLP